MLGKLSPVHDRFSVMQTENTHRMMDLPISKGRPEGQAGQNPPLISMSKGGEAKKVTEKERFSSVVLYSDMHDQQQSCAALLGAVYSRVGRLLAWMY